ncbi:MAG TPA: hypothetical protein ENK02_05815 [Planctomycetes bacterium]|nr:hypothetical protein [Planctomycetota bacterium]
MSGRRGGCEVASMIHFSLDSILDPNSAMQRRPWNKLPPGVRSWLTRHFPVLPSFPLPVELIVLEEGDRNPINPQMLRQGACLGILISNTTWTFEGRGFHKVVPPLVPFLLLPSGWPPQRFREVERSCREKANGGQGPGEN